MNINKQIILVAIIFVIFCGSCSDNTENKVREIDCIHIGLKNVGDIDINYVLLNLDNGKTIRFGWLMKNTRAINAFYPYFGETKEIEVVYIFKGKETYESRKITVDKVIRDKINKNNLLLIKISNKSPEIEIVVTSI